MRIKLLNILEIIITAGNVSYFLVPNHWQMGFRILFVQQINEIVALYRIYFAYYMERQDLFNYFKLHIAADGTFTSSWTILVSPLCVIPTLKFVSITSMLPSALYVFSNNYEREEMLINWRASFRMPESRSSQSSSYYYKLA